MMEVPHLHQAVGVTGAFEFLRTIESSPASSFGSEDIVGMMAEVGVADPDGLMADMMASNLLQRLGGRIGLSTLGIRTLLLLEALNGGDMRDIYRRLSHYDASLRMYELVREGMTKQFLQSLNDRPGFARLYVCSPWVRLDRRQRDLLVHAVLQEEQRGNKPELLVITRPGRENPPEEGLGVFVDLGATIFTNSRLHTKLYIREPGLSGGFPMAIVGSQNLTRSRYLELGIRVNADGVIVDQLIAYFWELCNASVEL